MPPKFRARTERIYAWIVALHSVWGPRVFDSFARVTEFLTKKSPVAYKRTSTRASTSEIIIDTEESQRQENELRSKNWMYTGGSMSPLIIKMSLTLGPPMTPLSKEPWVRGRGWRGVGNFFIPWEDIQRHRSFSPTTFDGIDVVRVVCGLIASLTCRPR